MKTILQKSRATGYLLFLFLLTVSFSWGQGMEDFTNSEAGSNYEDDSFVGNNGITWTYVHSRDANGDTNGSGINLPALMLRRVADGSKITSSEIPNGIGNFSVKLYKGFTGGGNRQVELFVNGISQGTSDAFDDYNEHVFEVNNINIDGNITIEIVNVTSRQVIIDDITWTSFGSGGNTGPFIANIAHNPSNVTSSDEVTISADIIDADGVASAQLRWGTTSGSLSNTLAMTVEVDDMYTATIPAQADGTVVFYDIVATDANASPETTTSPEQTYTVDDPTPFGIPYTNALRTNDDFANAEVLGFLFANANMGNPGANGYVKIDGGSITTPAIDFSAYDGLTVSFGLGTYGGNNGQELSVMISDDDGATYTPIGVFSHEDSTPATFEQVIDLTSLNGTNGRIKFEMTGGTASIRFRDLEIVESQGGNVGPVIANVEHNPLVVTSTDAVVVSAEITDLDGVASAELRWGTTSGSLSNTLAMTIEVDDTYTATIPAQADGTVVYYEIEATDANAVPISTISDEYNYTVQDPIPFGIPYYNAFANQDDYDEAVGYGFAFDNANQNGSYVRIINGSIITPAIDFSAYDEINLSFDLGTFGGSDGGQELSVSVSNDNGANYTVLGVFYPTSSTLTTFEQAVDLTSLNGTNGRIKFEMTGGSNSIRFNKLDIALPSVYSGYVYENGAWTPSDPSGVTTTDDIYVLNGTADLNGVVSANSLIIMPDATLNVNGVLNLTTDLDIQGDIVFTSTATANGELGTVGGVILGEATVQRYMSAQRSYRMVSSAVTTSTSINANWQEGVNNTGTGPGDNQNPNPGFGTHITGSATGANGFDATITGNPSIFTVDLANQEFMALDNTDANTLDAGKGYLLFVRGDRSIDLSNDLAAGETVLRAKGTLTTGTSSQSFDAINAGEFVMSGNPYQSAVDVNGVLANSTNINPNAYYVYDPTLGDHGAYVTVDLLNGGNNTSESNANEYLQPGQAAQFSTVSDGVSVITYNEADKAPGNFTTTNANHLTAENMLVMQLYTTDNFNNGGKVHDSFGMIFDDEFDNSIDIMDAVKPMNFNENFGVNNNGTYLSLERRAMPQIGETFELFTTGYKHSNYTVKVVVDGLEGSDIYLNDQYTGNSVRLEEGETIFNFTVDANEPMSIATDRFVVQVQNRLGVEDNNLLSGVQLYPNPTNGSFYINAPKLNGEEVMLTINDMLGRVVYTAEHTFNTSATRIDLAENLNSGVYLVKISSNGETKTLRVIKQ